MTKESFPESWINLIIDPELFQVINVHNHFIGKNGLCFHLLELAKPISNSKKKGKKSKRKLKFKILLD